MLDLAAELAGWADQGREFAVATVVSVSGSAPRPPGAALAVDSAGEVIGSVSGGCVEGAVYELCERALADGTPIRESFGYSDDDAFAVGLSCGGVVEVHVVPVRADSSSRTTVRTALALAARGEAVALARLLDGGAGLVLVRPDGTYEGALGTADDAGLAAQARAQLDLGHTGTCVVPQSETGCDSDVTLFVESSVPPARMIVFGAVDFAGALVRVGKLLGFHVTLCDARGVFATPARFPEADEVVVEWPDRYLRGTETDARTVLCVLTHDAKFDIPLLEVALRLPVAYVGAMGSRRTHDDRLRRLRDAGLGDRELARLRSPIGLDLGGRTPEETAVSIGAEIVAVRRGGSGVPLVGRGGPVHAG
ncbi:xanthine dehydrogenase [Streptomyces sp. SID8379]|uniref:XdhC family protein n=1 Tax=unclassified Streptomyces TaxID=2593676 RepID=UPI000360B055|nr:MULTISPECIES: XdhC/CoxI family protein [unclassified Streptomyces]MYW63446.1 xanthine dehydrogenase [Streptomyces sp. SID8379]